METGLVEQSTETSERMIRMPKHRTITARGLHEESKIDLWLLNYDGIMMANVFAYPMKVYLNGLNIRKLDERIFRVGARIITREFKDLSAEALDHEFLTRIDRISVMDYNYSLAGIRILAHSFNPGEAEYLKRTIETIKGRKP